MTPRGFLQRSPSPVTNPQILALRADIEKLEEKMKSRNIGDGAVHDAFRSLISIANAVVDAGYRSLLERLAAQLVAEHVKKADKNVHKLQEGREETFEVFKEAGAWLEVYTEVLSALREGGEADAETKVVQEGLQDADQEKKEL